MQTQKLHEGELQRSVREDTKSHRSQEPLKTADGRQVVGLAFCRARMSLRVPGHSPLGSAALISEPMSGTDHSVIGCTGLIGTHLKADEWHESRRRVTQINRP